MHELAQIYIELRLEENSIDRVLFQLRDELVKFDRLGQLKYPFVLTVTFPVGTGSKTDAAIPHVG